MGLLKQSETLTWEETKKATISVKERGIRYVAEICKQSPANMPTGFLWGEEIEQNIITKIDQN